MRKSNANPLTSKTIGILAVVLAFIMTIPVFMGYSNTLLNVGKFEMRTLRKSQIRKITSAFQFELAANESIYVEYRPGFMQGKPIIRIVVEGIVSESDFLLRYHGDIEKDEYNRHFGYGRRALSSIESWGAPLSVYNVKTSKLKSGASVDVNFTYSFTFYNYEDNINVEFITNLTSYTNGFSNVSNILFYHHLLHSSIFMIPLGIQIGLFAFGVAKIILQRRLRKKV